MCISPCVFHKQLPYEYACSVHALTHIVRTHSRNKTHRIEHKVYGWCFLFVFCLNNGSYNEQVLCMCVLVRLLVGLFALLYKHYYMMMMMKGNTSKVVGGAGGLQWPFSVSCSCCVGCYVAGQKFRLNTHIALARTLTDTDATHTHSTLSVCICLVSGVFCHWHWNWKNYDARELCVVSFLCVWMLISCS